MEGWPVGTIDHLVMDRETETTRWMAVSTGKFGTRFSLCPVADAWEGPEGGIRVPYVKDQVLAAPRADPHGSPARPKARKLEKHYAGGRVDRGCPRPETGEPPVVARAATGNGRPAGPDTDNWCAPIRRNGTIVAPDAAGWAGPVAGAPNGHEPVQEAANGQAAAAAAEPAPVAPRRS